MNSSIVFADETLFNLALTSLEMDVPPFYVTRGLSIETDDADSIVDILHSNGIYMFDVKRNEDDSEPNDDMDGDHASALASAGFGTDEDYGMAAYDERFECED